MAEGKQWARLTAERKFRIFLETRGSETPVGEILRRYSLTLEDLRAIEATVESAAVAGLKVRAGHRTLRAPVTPEEYERVCRELREKERALAELSVEYTLLKKNERSGSTSAEAGVLRKSCRLCCGNVGLGPVELPALREACGLERRPLGENLLVTPRVPLARRHVLDAAMVMRVVVPPEEPLAPRAGVLEALEPAGVIRPPLEGGEERLDRGVVIRGPGPGIQGLDPARSYFSTLH